ncbi:MAG: protein translocase subunit SecDF, partial [Bacteroidales bacterium]|nr:protein translocase subunit SecDF [Bacteroidales bacterium]
MSFTFVVNKVEKDAKEYAQNAVENGNYGKISDAERNGLIDQFQKSYLDSVDNEVVYRLIKKYTYKDCKERELNLGLDLRGGMNISLEIPAEGVLKSLARDKEDPMLLAIIAEVNKQVQEQTGTNYIQTFGRVYNEMQIADKPGLAFLFATSTNADKIQITSSNEEVIKYLEKEYDAAIGNAYDVINKRIDQFGVVQPNIQKDVAVNGVFHIELPGIKDPERVESLLKQAAKLEFYETYTYEELRQALMDADQVIIAAKKAEALRNAGATETAVADSAKNELAEANDSTATEEVAEVNDDMQYSIFSRLLPQIPGRTVGGPVVGFAKKADMESIKKDLARKEVKLPKDLQLAWAFKELKEVPGYYELIALKRSKDGHAALGGEVVTNAYQEFGQNSATAEVSMVMNNVGATQWARITKDNIGKSIAIVLDSAVYSYPVVNDEIKGGRSSITGNFTL